MFRTFSFRFVNWLLCLSSLFSVPVFAVAGGLTGNHQETPVRYKIETDDGSIESLRKNILERIKMLSDEKIATNLPLNLFHFSFATGGKYGWLEEWLGSSWVNKYVTHDFSEWRTGETTYLSATSVPVELLAEILTHPLKDITQGHVNSEESLFQKMTRADLELLQSGLPRTLNEMEAMGGFSTTHLDAAKKKALEQALNVVNLMGKTDGMSSSSETKEFLEKQANAYRTVFSLLPYKALEPLMHLKESFPGFYGFIPRLNFYGMHNSLHQVPLGDLLIVRDGNLPGGAPVPYATAVADELRRRANEPTLVNFLVERMGIRKDLAMRMAENDADLNDPAYVINVFAHYSVPELAKLADQLRFAGAVEEGRTGAYLRKVAKFADSVVADETNPKRIRGSAFDLYDSARTRLIAEDEKLRAAVETKETPFSFFQGRSTVVVDAAKKKQIYDRTWEMNQPEWMEKIRLSVFNNEDDRVGVYAKFSAQELGKRQEEFLPLQFDTSLGRPENEPFGTGILLRLDGTNRDIRDTLLAFDRIKALRGIGENYGGLQRFRVYKGEIPANEMKQVRCFIGIRSWIGTMELKEVPPPE
jgi:hypothetical protein